MAPSRPEQSAAGVARHPLCMRKNDSHAAVLAAVRQAAGAWSQVLPMGVLTWSDVAPNG